MSDYKKTGDRIKQRRLELGLKLSDVAEEVGVATSTIQRYEKGLIRSAKLPVIESIAHALYVNPAWLTLHTDDPTDYSDPDIIAEIPDRFMRAADGNARLAYKMMKAEWEDLQKENPIDFTDDGEEQIASIFRKLSEDNQSKLLELALLYLTSQNKTEEKQ